MASKIFPELRPVCRSTLELRQDGRAGRRDPKTKRSYVLYLSCWASCFGRILTIASTAAKLAFQLLPAKEQRRRPTVGTVMGIGCQLALSHQSFDLLRREAIARLHSGVTCHQAQQIVEELFAVG